MVDQKKRLIFHRILVPITGTDADDETVRMACWTARKDKSKLYAIHIITIQRSLPLEAEIEPETRKAEELLERIERVAEAEGCDIETDLLQAREVAPAIIDAAVARNIDLIVLGMRYQRKFGQFNLGNIVPYILKNASCQVMLYSQYSQ